MLTWRPSASLAALRERSRCLGQIRAFFAARDVVEVQTPMLGARTVTDAEVESIAVHPYGFLQTSPEYYMKRLLAAGAASIYQLGPAFRHEESGRLHNSEFTLLEWYRLGFDDRQLMQEVAELVDDVLGRGSYTSLTYSELLGGVDALKLERDEMDLKFVAAIERLGQGRFFITDYPADQAALARLRPGHEDVAARFELVIDGVEIANGYWELQSAAEHRRRFQADRDRRAQLDRSDVLVDECFIQALEHGLPDCAGVALGVDRLLMLALGETSLDAVLAFRLDRI